MRVAGYFFSSVAAWQVALGMIEVLLPLYVYDLGFPGLAIGSLISAPVLVQIVLRFVGGPAADRWGERNVLMASYAAMALAGPLFFVAKTFWLLLAAQGMSMMSRAIFYLAAQAMASRLPGDRTVQFGRLNAANQFGRIGGIAAGGFIYGSFGFHPGMAVVTALATLSLVLIARVQVEGGRGTGTPVRLLQHFGDVLRARAIYYAMICSFVAAVPVTLTQSFFPIYMAALRYPSDQIGVLISMRSVSAGLCGLLLARSITRGRRSWLNLLGIGTVAATVGVTPLFTHWSTLSLVLLLMGAGSLVSDMYQQIVSADTARSGQRATAMAMGGFGWNLSHVIVPVVFGALSDAYGLAAGFFTWGGLLLLLGLLSIWVNRWAFGGETRALSSAGAAPP